MLWPGEPLLWIDHSLSPFVARALNLVGYAAFTFKDTTEFGDELTVSDEEIIEWCGSRTAIWVHADDNAKVEHKKLMEIHGTKTIWVYRPAGRMTAREQLRALAYGLPKALDRLAKRKFQHVAIRVHGQPPDHGYRVDRLTL